MLLKYSADEARSLKSYGGGFIVCTVVAGLMALELPTDVRINETDTYGHEGDEAIGFEFDDDRESDEGGEVDVDDI